MGWKQYCEAQLKMLNETCRQAEMINEWCMIYPCPKRSKENERNTDKAPFRAGGDIEFRIYNF